MKSFMKFLILAVTLTGCGADPYEGQSREKLLAEKPEAKPQQVVSWSLEAPAMVEAYEGTPLEFSFAPYSSNGDYEVILTNVPEGSTYDPAERRFSWFPGAGKGRDPRDPRVTNQRYLVNAELRSLPDRVVRASRTVVLVVFATPSRLRVTDRAEAAIVANETSPTRNDFQIIDDRFPNGPFRVSATGLPSGVSLELNGPLLTASWTAGLRTVKSSETCRLPGQSSLTVGCKELAWDLVVTNPAGESAVLPVRWFAADRPQPLLIATPTQVTATSNVASFFVDIEDPNGEGSPTITSVQDNVTVTTISAGRTTADRQFFRVDWRSPAATPVAQTVMLKACVTVAVRGEQCTSFEVAISLGSIR